MLLILPKTCKFLLILLVILRRKRFFYFVCKFSFYPILLLKLVHVISFVKFMNLCHDFNSLRYASTSLFLISNI